MSRLPLTLAQRYRPATDLRVRSWSFGQLNAIRDSPANSWKQQRGTLDDQSIFGTKREWECACGKYRGPSYRNMICDICGVKVTSPNVRRQRFGHIEMLVSIQHPLSEEVFPLSTVPVLPATFVESSGGEALAGVYEDLVRSGASASLENLRIGWGRLIELLLPVLTFAHQWDLQEAATIARGLALELRTAPSDVCCEYCGYPLGGLDTRVCPGCGKRC